MWLVRLARLGRCCLCLLRSGIREGPGCPPSNRWGSRNRISGVWQTLEPQNNLPRQIENSLQTIQHIYQQKQATTLIQCLQHYQFRLSSQLLSLFCINPSIFGSLHEEMPWHFSANLGDLMIPYSPGPQHTWSSTNFGIWLRLDIILIPLLCKLRVTGIGACLLYLYINHGDHAWHLLAFSHLVTKARLQAFIVRDGRHI